MRIGPSTIWAARARAFLALGRVWHLPTVWSNCLAGWWLGGDANPHSLPALLAAATFLFLGGAFLNDAFDADYDRQLRRTRPIPSGAISPEAAWRWGLVWLALGEISCFWLGLVPGTLGLALLACVLVYNAAHRLITFSPVLLGACRFWLYALAGATAAGGLTGWPLWCGLAMACYVTGLRFLLRWRLDRASRSYWPLLLLSVPAILALLMDAGGYRQDSLLVLAILVLWTLRCLRRTLWSPEPNVEGTISGLVAGIALVDWLAVADAPRPIAGLFIGLFLLTLVLQRLRLTA